MGFYRSDNVSPLDANPTKYRSREHSPLEAGWTPPNLPSLWGWFKFNEGSGNSIIDYSPIAEPGCWLYQDAGVCWEPGSVPAKNWSVSGFGHNDLSPPNSPFRRVATVPRASQYMSFVGFIRPLGFGGAGYAILGGNVGGANNIAISWDDWGDNTVRFWIVGDSTQYGITHFPLNQWYCLFAYSSNQVDINKVVLYIRPSGGSWSKEAEGLPIPNNTNHQSLYSFGVNSDRNMDGGDHLYYIDVSSSGVITLSQANDIYNNLKSRYGMS